MKLTPRRLSHFSNFSKGAFTHPVYACVFRNALRFFYYLPWFVDIYGKKSYYFENATQWGKRMWKPNVATGLYSLTVWHVGDGLSQSQRKSMIRRKCIENSILQFGLFAVE